MRKVSQSLQPKVGRLCTATKPSYPCHLWGETVSLGTGTPAPGCSQREETVPRRWGSHCIPPAVILARPSSPASPTGHSMEGPSIPASQSPQVTITGSWARRGLLSLQRRN